MEQQATEKRSNRQQRNGETGNKETELQTAEKRRNRQQRNGQQTAG